MKILGFICLYKKTLKKNKKSLKKIKKNLNANLKKRIFDIIIVHSNLIRNEYYAIRNNKYFIKSNTNLGSIENYPTLPPFILK